MFLSENFWRCLSFYVSPQTDLIPNQVSRSPIDEMQILHVNWFTIIARLGIIRRYRTTPFQVNLGSLFQLKHYTNNSSYFSPVTYEPEANTDKNFFLYPFSCILKIQTLIKWDILHIYTQGIRRRPFFLVNFCSRFYLWLMFSMILTQMV